MQRGKKGIEGSCPARHEGRSERKQRRASGSGTVPLFHFLLGLQLNFLFERCLRRKEITNEKGADSSYRRGSACAISGVDGKCIPDLYPVTFPE
jgi:hypothetical protein